MIKLKFTVLPIILLCISCAYSNKMEFNCTITGKRGDLVTWYQKKDSDPGHIILNRTQLMDTNSINIPLHWTPEQTDNNTQIYCVHEDLSKNTSYGFKTPINVTFRNITEPRESFVTVTPDEDTVDYEINKTLSLLCNGTDPVDGQELTWYIQGEDSNLQLAKKQTFNSTTNINNLVLRLDETHNGKKIFCAQDFHFQHLPAADGTIITDRYRELAKSKIINLIHKNNTNEIGENKDIGDNNNKEQGKENTFIRSEGEIESNINRKTFKNYSNVENGDKAEKHIGQDSNDSPLLRFPLVLVIPVAVIAVVAVVAGVWFRCSRRAKIEDGHDKNELTFVVPVQTSQTAKPNSKKDAAVNVSTPLDSKVVPVQTSQTASPDIKKDAGVNVPTPLDSKDSAEVTYAALDFVSKKDAALNIPSCTSDPKDSTEVTCAALDFVSKKDAALNIPSCTSDPKASGEVTYLALEFSAKSGDTNRLRIDQSSDYATIMASQAFGGQS